MRLHASGLLLGFKRPQSTTEQAFEFISATPMFAIKPR